MIAEICVENLAIIERATLHLGAGLTVLTGETGAGKSLLIDAIELALGERADTDLIRTGASKATVAVVFDLNKQPGLANWCRDEGYELDDGSLFVDRSVVVEGRSRCRVGGIPVPVSALKPIGAQLIDLHGQHDHQSLLDPSTHVSFLDQWIGAPAQVALSECAQLASEVVLLRERLRALRAGMRDREHRLDLLRFQVNEIESVGPKPGEYEELEAQLSRLKHAEKLAKAAFGALESLVDAENCASDQLGDSIRMLEEVSRFDESLAAIIEPLQDALIQLNEGTHSLRSYADGLESDPSMLDEIAGRLDSLKRLRRKYGESEEAVLAFLETATTELDVLMDSEANEEEWEARLSEAETKLRESAQRLTAIRKGKADEFANLVVTQLKDLAMEKARFEVAFADRQPDAQGADVIEFLFSANAGELPRPLAKIASGGEISRVMLSIKTALAGKAGVPTLIFDEVDSGLGGRVAATVGRKMQELAEHYQVVAISHLPQIASRASTHFRIEKRESGGRVATAIRKLEGEERVEEIARMLAGEQITESALANARELLGLNP